MKGITTFRRTTLIISLLVVIVLLLTLLIGKQKREVNIQSAAERFAGSDVCSNCHKRINESHLNTAHYLTSRPALEKFIKGSFSQGSNVFSFNDSVNVAMEKSDAHFTR